MSRFECLNNNNWQTKRPKNEKNYKQKKDYNNYNNYKKTKTNSVKIIKKEERNFLDEKLFPSLVENKETKKNTLENYIGIVNHEIKTEKVEERIPSGWTMLYKKDNKIIMEKGKLLNNNYNRELQEENERYTNSNIILDNRYYERLELNKILGDISPYWNMDEQYMYDTREDESMDVNESSDSDYENEEEFY